MAKTFRRSTCLCTSPAPSLTALEALNHLATSAWALFVLCGVLTALGQDQLRPAGLKQEPVHGLTAGVTDGDNDQSPDR